METGTGCDELTGQLDETCGSARQKRRDALRKRWSWVTEDEEDHLSHAGARYTTLIDNDSRKRWDVDTDDDDGRLAQGRRVVPGLRSGFWPEDHPREMGPLNWTERRAHQSRGKGDGDMMGRKSWDSF